MRKVVQKMLAITARMALISRPLRDGRLESHHGRLPKGAVGEGHHVLSIIPPATPPDVAGRHSVGLAILDQDRWTLHRTRGHTQQHTQAANQPAIAPEPPPHWCCTSWTRQPRCSGMSARTIAV